MQATSVYSRLPAKRHLAVLLIGAALWAVLFEFNPVHHTFYPRCILQQTTGLYCPACGATRATYQLLHGHLRAAIAYNSLYVFSLPILLYWLGREGLRLVGLLRSPRKALPTWASVAIFGTLILFGIARNLPWQPFRPLAPHDLSANPQAVSGFGVS